ncbi:MAG: hypothetical protein RR740_00345 [Pseudomonas sp.]
MKDRIVNLYKKVTNWAANNAVIQGLGVVGIIIGAIIAVVAVLGLVIGTGLGLIFLRVMGPGLACGFLSWLAWTKVGIGATYFYQLAPVYQVIPFWHLVFAWTAVVFILRVLRKPTYGKLPPLPKLGDKLAELKKKVQ